MPTFDPKAILKADPPPKRLVLTDAVVSNLKLYHYPSGSMTLVWRARWDGGVREIRLGEYPDKVAITTGRHTAKAINAARDMGVRFAEYEAERAPTPRPANTNVVVANDEVDDTGLIRVAVVPRGAAAAVVRASNAVAATDHKTCDWMFDLYWEREASALDSADEKRRMYNRDLKPVIGHRSIFEIKHDDLDDILHAKAATAPIQSNRLHSLIRRWFRWSCTLGRRETGMTNALNPAADLVKLSKPNSKDRFLADYEIALFLRALDVQPTVMNEGWRLVLYTGVRRDEAFAAPFGEFDLETGDWTIPKARTKTGTELLLPLPPQALAVVRRAVAAKKGDDQTLLWPSRGIHMQNRGPDQMEQPRSGFSKAAKAIHATMEAIAAADPLRPRNFVLKPWSTHDLRRTLATQMNGMRGQDFKALIDSELVERILNHKIPGVRGVYDRWGYYAEKKHALELWANHLDEIEVKFIERLSHYQPEG